MILGKYPQEGFNKYSNSINENKQGIKITEKNLEGLEQILLMLFSLSFLDHLFLFLF